MASAQEYAQITELSRRVAEWEERVVPKLEEEVSTQLKLFFFGGKGGGVVLGYKFTTC